MPKSTTDRKRVGQVILFKRPNSPFWYVKYPVGKREIRSGKSAGQLKPDYRVRSTGETRLRQAELVAQSIDLDLFKGKVGACSGHFPLAQLRQDFLEYQEHDTDNRFRQRTKTFVKWASGKGLQYVADVTTQIAELFVRHLRHDRQLQDRTVKNYVTAIGSMFAWAQSRQPPLAESNPFSTGKGGQLQITAGPASTRSEDERYETYTADEICCLVNAAIKAGDVDIARMILVLAETGLRFGELQFLCPSDIDWPKGIIHIRMKQVQESLHPELERLLDRQGRWWPKDERTRYVYMTPTCYKVMEQACPPGGVDRAWVFCDSSGRQVQDQGARERLQRYATQAGIMPFRPERGKHAGKEWSRANWKMLRNYFVSRAASSGMELMHVMAATGHDSFQMVQHYFRLNADEYRKDFTKFDGGLTGIDLSDATVTKQGNTLGTHSVDQPLQYKDLETERAGFEPAVRV